MVQSKHDGDDGDGGVDAWRDEMPTVYRDTAAELSRHQTHVNIEQTWIYIHVATVFSKVTQLKDEWWSELNSSNYVVTKYL